jgi:hypothetical protein
MTGDMSVCQIMTMKTFHVTVRMTKEITEDPTTKKVLTVMLGVSLQGLSFASMPTNAQL